MLHVCAPAVCEKPLLHLSSACDASPTVASYSRFSVYEYVPPVGVPRSGHCFGLQIGICAFHSAAVVPTAVHVIVALPISV